MALLDVLGDGLDLLAAGLVDEIVLILADHVAVGGNDHHAQLVDLLELGGLGIGRTRHAAQLLVEPEQVLEGDGGQGLVLALDGHVFLGLDGLVEPVRIAAAFHEAAGELVDDDDLAVADHVIHVPLEDHVGAQGLRIRGAPTPR